MKLHFVLHSSLTLALLLGTSTDAFAQGLPQGLPQGIKPVPVPADQVPAAIRDRVQKQLTAPPTGAPTPAVTPPAPLPPALSASEQRFRDMQNYVRTRGAVDASMHADLAALATLIDADLSAATTSRESMLRLLPARAQLAIWLDDSAAMDSAFERLIALNPTSEGAVIGWAKELTATARFDRAVQLLQSHAFTVRDVDAKIALGDALTGLHQFDDSQAAYNGASNKRTPLHQQLITAGTLRTQKLREMWERELVAMGRDQQRDDLPLVEIITPKGSVQLELFEEQAPNTCGSFIEHVEAGHYDGTTMHRFLRGIGVQGGDPLSASGETSGTSTGGWTIPDETDRGDRRAPLVGRLIMAKQTPSSGAPEIPLPNSAGSQFMVLFAPMPELDANYTVFGRVFDGLDVVKELTRDDAIVSARVIRKRNHEYRATRLTEASTGSFRMPRSTSEGGNKPPAAPAVKNAGGPVNIGTTPSANPTFPKDATKDATKSTTPPAAP